MDIMKTIQEFLKNLLQYHDLGNSMNFSEEFEHTISDDIDNSDSYSVDYRGILITYFYLVSKDMLSASEAEYLGKILELAESDTKLALLMNEVDEFTYQDLGYSNSEYLYEFENERARALETIVEQPNLEMVIEQPDESSTSDYEVLLSDYCALAMRSAISDVEAEYMGRILDQAQSDSKLALLLSVIDELSYEKMGFMEQASAEAMHEQARQHLSRIMILSQFGELKPSSLSSDIVIQHDVQQRWQLFYKQHLEPTIRVSQTWVKSNITWGLIVGSVCSAALIRCSTLLVDTPQFFGILMGQQKAFVLPTAPVNLSGVVQLQTREIPSGNVIAINDKPPPSTLWGKANLESPEALNQAESIESDSRVQLLSPINSSQQQPEAALEVISSPNSIVAVVDIHQPEESENFHSSCCGSIQTSVQVQENQSVLKWSIKADPLLGKQWVVQPDDIPSKTSFEVSTARFQPDEDLDLELAAILYANHSSHSTLQEIHAMQGQGSSKQTASAW